MELPRVNRLSGTMPSDLLESYLEARRVVKGAVEALGAVWPHGRDYQGGNVNAAMDEHVLRLQALRIVVAELEIIAESITNQL